MKIVNGFVCECSTDVRYAKRGIDPDNPRENPAKAEQLALKRGEDLQPRPVEESQGAALDPNRRGGNAAFDIAAVSLGGRLAELAVEENGGPSAAVLDVQV